MHPISTIQQWLAAGKQIGTTFSYEKAGQTHWASVGVQWWNGAYQIYLSDIPEILMAMSEEHLQEEVVEVARYEDIAPILAVKSSAKLENLAPCKGQKVFNPKFS